MTAEKPPPVSELGEAQLQLPGHVGKLPETATENRHSAYYGHSEAWRRTHPWTASYALLRSSMQRSAARQQSGSHRLRLSSIVGGEFHGLASSVAADDSASKVEPSSLIGMRKRQVIWHFSSCWTSTVRSTSADRRHSSGRRRGNCLYRLNRRSRCFMCCSRRPQSRRRLCCRRFRL